MTSGLLGFEEVLLTILALLLLIILGGCVYAFLYAIFMFIFSQGDPEKKKSAWNSIRYMVIGLIFSLVLFVVFPVAFRYLRVDGYEVYTARNVFLRAGEILNQFFRFGRMVSETNTGPGGNIPRYDNFSL